MENNQGKRGYQGDQTNMNLQLANFQIPQSYETKWQKKGKTKLYSSFEDQNVKKRETQEITSNKFPQRLQ